jgi:hypothetical protein
MTNDQIRHLEIARRWFTDGWAGQLALADDIFGDVLRTNGAPVGVAGPKGRISERNAAFPHLAVEIATLQDQFGLLRQTGFLPPTVHSA